MGGCGEMCKNEFNAKRFLLHHDNPQTFVQFQFGCQTLYLVWRIFWALYHVVWIIYTVVRIDMWVGDDSSQYIKWFIFLTDWAYFTLTLSTVVDALVVLYVFVRRRDIRQDQLIGDASSLPWYMKANWCIFNLGSAISVATSVTYWSVVYDGTQGMTSINIATHIINSLYVILNISVSGMPMQILHGWFSVVFGIVYVLFSLFYYLVGGTNHHEKPYIYSALDWSKPGTAIMYSAIVALVLVPLVQTILFGIHSLKVLIYEKCECCRISTEGNRNSTVEMKAQCPY